MCQYSLNKYEAWQYSLLFLRRSNASTDSGLKSSNANKSELVDEDVCPLAVSPLKTTTNNKTEPTNHHRGLFKKNTTVISCTHHKGLKCTQMTLARHYSLSSLLEALPAASVDAEDIDKHASLSSLSSGSRCSDYDGYFYIWNAVLSTAIVSHMILKINPRIFFKVFYYVILKVKYIFDSRSYKISRCF